MIQYIQRNILRKTLRSFCSDTNNNNNIHINSEVVKLLKNRKINIYNIDYNTQYETRDHKNLKKNNYFFKSNVSPNLGNNLKDFYSDVYSLR